MDSDQPQHETLASERQIDAALERLLARVQRRLWLFDIRLARGFGSAVRGELLRRFLLSNRENRMRIVLHDTSTLARDCPRLLTLLRQLPYAIAIHETEPQAKSVFDPFVVGDERDHLHRFHFENARGLLALDDPQATLPFVRRFEEIWAASAPAVSATTLGL